MLRILLLGLLLLLVGCSDTPNSTDSANNGVADAASDAGDAANDASEDADMRALREPDNHRPVATICDAERAPGGDQKFPPPAGPGCDDPEPGCTGDEDCSAGANGRCVSFNADLRYCTYDDCRRDEDCQGDAVCSCNGEGSWASDNNVCVGPGDCVVDADCGPSGYCSPSRDFCGPDFVIGYFCHTPNDECVNDSDCGKGYCQYSQNYGFWACQVQSVCGCE